MMYSSNPNKKIPAKTSPSSQDTPTPHVSTSVELDSASLAMLAEQKTAIANLYQQMNWTAENLVEQQPFLQALQDETHKLKGGVSYLTLDDLNLSCPQFYAVLLEVVKSHRLPKDFHAQYEQMLVDLDAALHELSPQSSTESLSTFLQRWEADYAATVKPYKIFQPEITALWDSAQRKKFARYFYHIRGHFLKFLWLLGNEAEHPAAKQKVLDNIGEEFGGAGMSHEKLYYVFAEAVGVADIKTAEWLDEIHHVPVIKKYNQAHLTWLNSQAWASKWAAFAAYEKLDNIDYANLYTLANSFGLESRSLAFFKIHQQADHFDRLQEDLQLIWQQQPQVVRAAFYFIGKHQSEIWQWLSGVLCAA